MSNERIEKRIEFIIDQQAQFTTDMNLLKESQAQFTERVDRLASQVEALAAIQAQAEVRLGRVEESFILLVQMARITDERLDNFGEKMAMLTEAQTRTDNKLADLAEAQTHTDERLNTLIDVVERYISKGSDGNSRN